MIIALLEDEREAAVLAATQIEHLAYHDPLTGLPNRALFFDRLMIAIANADRYQHRSAVLFFDLDRFKEINDSLGHSMGDALLRAVAKRVRETVRQVDTLSRFGGDEFTLLVTKVDQPEDANLVAAKVLEVMKEPFVVGGRELSITTSIGVSVYPEDGLDAESLVKNSDAAMYRAKQRGRDNYQMYTPGLNAKALERLELETRLRHALDYEELEIYYQPLVDVPTRTITGFEALLRWRHPDLGVIGPNEFIQAAEVSGLIVPIGDWVLRKACRQAKVWQIQYARPLVAAVNLSARQFLQHNLVERVRYALDESGLDARLLELEITESSAMENADNSIRVMRELERLGVRLALDDFGTGYSSLNYLRRFPLATLKLDREFVQEIGTPGDGGVIAVAVISMAHSLGLKVVAEGVETERQNEFLREHQCDTIQGFVYSPPVPAAQFETFLADKLAPFRARAEEPRIRPADAHDSRLQAL
jgi:diguanylate cyclase (GGDEF)-like protein